MNAVSVVPVNHDSSNNHTAGDVSRLIAGEVAVRSIVTGFVDVVAEVIFSPAIARVIDIQRIDVALNLCSSISSNTEIIVLPGVAKPAAVLSRPLNPPMALDVLK